MMPHAFDAIEHLESLGTTADDVDASYDPAEPVVSAPVAAQYIEGRGTAAVRLRVVSVEDVRSPGDVFLCEKNALKLSAAACVQMKAGAGRTFRETVATTVGRVAAVNTYMVSAAHVGCRKCQVGETIAKKVAGKVQ